MKSERDPSLSTLSSPAVSRFWPEYKEAVNHLIAAREKINNMEALKVMEFIDPNPYFRL